MTGRNMVKEERGLRKAGLGKERGREGGYERIGGEEVIIGGGGKERK